MGEVWVGLGYIYEQPLFGWIGLHSYMMLQCHQNGPHRKEWEGWNSPLLVGLGSAHSRHRCPCAEVLSSVGGASYPLSILQPQLLSNIITILDFYIITTQLHLGFLEIHKEMSNVAIWRSNKQAMQQCASYPLSISPQLLRHHHHLGFLKFYMQSSNLEIQQYGNKQCIKVAMRLLLLLKGNGYLY